MVTSGERVRMWPLTAAKTSWFNSRSAHFSHFPNFVGRNVQSGNSSHRRRALNNVRPLLPHICFAITANISYVRPLNGFIVSIQFPWRISSKFMWWILPLHKWIEWLFEALYSWCYEDQLGSCIEFGTAWPFSCSAMFVKTEDIFKWKCHKVAHSLRMGGTASLSPDWTPRMKAVGMDQRNPPTRE